MIALPGYASYNGKIDFADLIIVAQNYNLTTGQTWLRDDYRDGLGCNRPYCTLYRKAGHEVTRSAGDPERRAVVPAVSVPAPSG